MSAAGDLAHYLADRVPELEGRVYPLLGRQGEPHPCLIYQQDSDEPGYELAGDAGYSELQLSYTVWSDDYTQCERVLDQVRLVLEAVADRTIGDTPIDVVLADGGEADGVEIIDGAATGRLSKSQAFFVRYFRPAALAPGV